MLSGCTTLPEGTRNCGCWREWIPSMPKDPPDRNPKPAQRRSTVGLSRGWDYYMRRVRRFAREIGCRCVMDRWRLSRARLQSGPGVSKGPTQLVSKVEVISNE